LPEQRVGLLRCVAQEALDVCFSSMPELRNPAAPKPPRRPLDPSKPTPKFTRAQVAKHASRHDAWIIVDGKVRSPGG
jgi:hypothetical protein